MQYFLFFRVHPKNGEGNKQSICARVTKHPSKKVVKAKVNLNWLWTIDYQLFWLYSYIHKWFNLFDTNVQTGFIISLFLAAPAPRVRKVWDLMGTSVRDGLRFFLLFGKKYYFIKKLSFLINIFFGNVFLTSEVIGFITLVYSKLILTPRKKYFFRIIIHWKPSFHKFCVVSMF